MLAKHPETYNVGGSPFRHAKLCITLLEAHFQPFVFASSPPDRLHSTTRVSCTSLVLVHRPEPALMLCYAHSYGRDGRKRPGYAVHCCCHSSRHKITYSDHIGAPAASRFALLLSSDDCYIIDFAQFATPHLHFCVHILSSSLTFKSWR